MKSNKMKTGLLSLLLLLPAVGYSLPQTAADFDENYRSPYSLHWESIYDYGDGNEYHLGVACMGRHTDLKALMMSRIWVRTAYAYPDVVRTIETIAADAGGDEFYLVVPRSATAKVTVTADNKTIYTGSGQPFLLRCSGGTAQIALDDAEGHRVRYIPKPSDGSEFGLSDQVIEFTLTPEEKFETEQSATSNYEQESPDDIRIRIEQGRVVINFEDGATERICSMLGTKNRLKSNRYEVQGLAKNCVGIKLSDIGQDWNPILAMWMEDGTLEVLSLFSAISHDDWTSSGPRLKNIVSHTGFPSEEYTSFAVVDNRCRDYEVPIAHFASIHEMAGGNHRLLLTPDWKIRYDNYQGHYELLEESDDYGLFRLGYTMTAPDGKQVKGVFTLDRRDPEKGDIVTPVEGPIDFGASNNKNMYKVYF